MSEEKQTSVSGIKCEILGALGGVILLLLSCGLSYLGMAGQVLVVLLGVTALYSLGRLALACWRRSLNLRWWHEGTLRDKSSTLVRGSFWTLVPIGLCVTYAPWIFILSAPAFYGILFGLWLLCVLGAAMLRYRTWSMSACYGIGGLVLAVQVVGSLSSVAGEPVVLAPPFRGEWAIVQGGNTLLINHHARLAQQHDALDFVMLTQGGILPEDADSPSQNSDWPSWEEPLYAPARGKVVRVVDGIEDSEGMNLDGKNPAGNHIVFDIGQGQYVLLAHLRHKSIKVKEGQSVSCGQPLGLVGNSGNTSMPHLHMQLQTTSDIYSAENRTIPMRFVGSTRVRGSSKEAGPIELRRPDRIIVPDEDLCRAL
jgi:hypothetical protein